jgi:hypothetical protein
LIEATMAAKPKPAAKRPAPVSEAELAALEYHASSEALREAEVRRGRAKSRCIAVGALPNYEADPFPEGTVATVFDGDRVRIVMTVVASIERFDHVGFIEDVKTLGIDARKLSRLVKKFSIRLRPAHVFKTSLTPG